MCGIAGIISPYPLDHPDQELIKTMTSAQKHRGPDDEGFFYNKFCALGHRRLSIIDLTKNGHQPFSSEDNRYHLIFNGEIYNYIELREDLKNYGYTFTTNTDTEVLLKAYQKYDSDCLQKLNGMFAFAIYDSLLHKLFIARDRVGVKPLYYTQINKKVYFASEIKAITKIPELRKEINQQSIFDFLVFNRTNIFDETFYSNIKKLPKGHFATIINGDFNITKWWDPEKFLSQTSEDTQNIACDKINDILISSIKLRLRSDVPVGSCLSGGLDSSIIIGIINHLLGKENKFSTFSAIFPGHKCNEKYYMDKVINHFNILNYTTIPDEKNFYDNLINYLDTQEEPSTTPSSYAQYEVMKLAKEHKIPVLLDGQGGDENFAGYHYFHGFFLQGLLLKNKYKEFLNESIHIIKRRQNIKSIQTLLFQILPQNIKKTLLLHNSNYLNKDFFNKYLKDSIIFNKFFDSSDLNTNIVRHFQYKLEHLLMTEDKNSMAFSIETRLPFLDYRLIEYMLSLNESFKIKNGETKYLQKLALKSFTIPEILNRKDKIGLETPTAKWLNTELWRKFTSNAYSYCEQHFPDIFKKDLNKYLNNNYQEQWKLTHLAIWHDRFINNSSNIII